MADETRKRTDLITGETYYKHEHEDGSRSETRKKINFLGGEDVWLTRTTKKASSDVVQANFEARDAALRAQQNTRESEQRTREAERRAAEQANAAEESAERAREAQQRAEDLAEELEEAEAIRQYDLEHPLEAKSEAMYYEANEYLAAGLPAEALPLITEAIRMRSNSPLHYLVLYATVQWRCEHKKEAKKNLRTVLRNVGGEDKILQGGYWMDAVWEILGPKSVSEMLRRTNAAKKWSNTHCNYFVEKNGKWVGGLDPGLETWLKEGKAAYDKEVAAHRLEREQREAAVAAAREQREAAKKAESKANEKRRMRVKASLRFRDRAKAIAYLPYIIACMAAGGALAGLVLSLVVAVFTWTQSVSDPYFWVPLVIFSIGGLAMGGKRIAEVWRNDNY